MRCIDAVFTPKRCRYCMCFYLPIGLHCVAMRRPYRRSSWKRSHIKNMFNNTLKLLFLASSKHHSFWALLPVRWASNPRPSKIHRSIADGEACACVEACHAGAEGPQMSGKFAL